MTVQALPSAVYHCNVPIKSASAVYGSNNNGRRPSKPQAPPIPAWPDIEDIDDWLCLPGLKRAVFLCHRGKVPQSLEEPDQLGLELEYIETHRGEYSPDVVAEARLLSFYYNIGLGEPLDSVNSRLNDFVALAEKSSGEARLLHRNAIRWAESQLLEGGYKDTFSAAHERGHSTVLLEGVYSALAQNAQSDIIHGLLETIATTPQLMPRDLRNLWNEFFAANDNFVRLVQKFEVIEEIVANQQGLWNLAPEVRSAVVGELLKAIQNKGYWSLFSTFLMDGCRSNPNRALPLMELITILHDRFNMSLDEALLKSIAALDNMVGLDASLSLDEVDEWITAKAPLIEPILGAVKELRRTSKSLPRITLTRRGNKADLEVHPIPTIDSISVEVILWHGFWESLRQQIGKVCGLTCPYKRDGLPCCGRSSYLENLWTRLPKQYQVALSPPTCVSTG